MRQFTLVIFLFSIVGCNRQHKLKEYNIPEVNWTLRIPEKSNFLDSLQFDTISKKAVNVINTTYNSEIDFKDVQSLFTIRQGEYNLLGSTLNTFDTTSGMTWEQSYAASKEMLLQVINGQAPTVQIIDTLSSVQLIDGLRFEKLYLKTYYPDKKLTMNTVWLYRKKDKYDFSINVSYTDEKIGRQYLEIIANSKFEK
jgi:hypothetical protein